MITTRTYFNGCNWCNATGLIPSKDFGMNTTPLMITCPVCNGSKVITVTESFESKDESLREDKYPDTEADGYVYCGKMWGNELYLKDKHNNKEK
jgi:hypothetical protein